MGDVTEAASRLVWNRARGLCSICRGDLVDKIGGDPKITGKVAHITAKKPAGPRYDDSLTDSERNGYGNLMLLCGSCHDKVDVAPAHYTVAKLHGIKADHEAYCGRLLTVDDERRAIAGEILANAVDLVVEGASLDRWDEWTCEILDPSRYRWPQWALKGYREVLRPAVYAVLWPKQARSLEVASKLLVQALLELYWTFCMRSEPNRRDGGVLFDYLVCPTRHEALEGRGPGYGLGISDAKRKAMEKFIKDWDTSLELAMVHLAKCVNLFADAVREHVNPRFRTTEGAFVIEPCRFGGEHGVYLFSEGEKANILERGCQRQEKPNPWSLVGDIWNNPPLKEDYGVASDFMEF